ncbi:MAG: hypothetical protein ACC707_06650 [Thiohalomonadales bacterium]
MKLPKKNVRAFSVSPSVLNPVKLELGIIIFVALMLWAAVNVTINDPSIQFAVLFLFSLSAASWIILRIKYIVKNLSTKQNTQG